MVSNIDKRAESLSFSTFAIVFPLVNCNLTAIHYSLTVSNDDKWAEKFSLGALSMFSYLLTAV